MLRRSNLLALLALAALPTCTGPADKQAAGTTAVPAAAAARPVALPPTSAAGPLTAKYAGEYSWGDDQREAAGGTLTVYPESDSTVLFYVDVCNGAPAYHLAQLLGRASLKGNVARHFSQQDYDEHGCQLKITFSPSAAVVESVPGFEDCDFGQGVGADGTYKRVSHAIPQLVTDSAGDTLRFARLPAGQLRNRP